MKSRTSKPGLEAFWEDADVEASSEHPLEREIAERVDALSRYGTLIEDAQIQGRDDLADLLLAQLAREEDLVRALRAALRRMRAERR